MNRSRQGGNKLHKKLKQYIEPGILLVDELGLTKGDNMEEAKIDSVHGTGALFATEKLSHGTGALSATEKLSHENGIWAPLEE